LQIITNNEPDSFDCVQIRQVDAEILDAVRRQCVSGSKVKEDLNSAHAMVHSMVGQIREIERRSAMTQTMVADICRDIKKLDNAKKNLNTTITALRRLSMLIDAVDQLQDAAEKRDFQTASELMGAVHQLSAHFIRYNHIPRVAELKGRIYALEKSLRTASLREFELIGEDIPPPHMLEQLSHCCALTGAIGASARDELVDTLCRREMSIYTQIFGTVGETARLDRTVNRYKWFIRRLDARKKIWSIFPEDWKVMQLLAVTFCSITKSELAAILDENSRRIRSDIDGLMKAVEATHVFEEEMSRRFNTVNTKDNRDIEDENDAENTFLARKKDAPSHMQGSAEEIRRKYQSALSEKDEKNARLQDAAAAAVSLATFNNSISPVFHPYMYVYVEDAERVLKAKLDESLSSETWAPMSQEQLILKSSDTLTSNIREEMRHCAAKISRGKTLLDLSKSFKRVYQSYASGLLSKLPKTVTGSTTGMATIGSTSWHIKTVPKDIDLLCIVISTSEHCISMLGQLERALETRLEAEYKNDVDMTDVEEEYANLVTQCLSVLLLGVETKLDVPLSALMRKNWLAVDVTGDQSEYMLDISKILRDTSALIKPPRLSNLYYRFFCDKLLRSFASRLLTAIYRCGPVSQAGGQQLRLDLEALRSALVSIGRHGDDIFGSSISAASLMPSSSQADGKLPYDRPSSPDSTSISAPWSQTFASDVSLVLGRIELVLKVVTAPVDSLVDTFMELLPGGTSRDLHLIMELMGLRKADTERIVEDFRSKGGTYIPSSASSGGAQQESIAGAATNPMLSRSLQSSSFSLPPGAAAKASAAAQDMASRIRLNANAQVAKLSAAGVSADSVRETMGKTLGAVRSFMRDQQNTTK